MIRQILLLIFTCLAFQAHARNCPDFYRFVDFGQIGDDGITYRGGTILRGESLTGTSLLLDGQTECVSVSTRAADGHGNPIPVVTRVSYDPTKAGLALNSLRIVRSEDIATTAHLNAATHRENLSVSSHTRARGTNFLCVAGVDGTHTSCQIVSPYRYDHALIVYCDLSECRMPVMAMTETLSIEAAWSSTAHTENDLAAHGSAIAQKVIQIHDFLADLF